MLKYQAKVAFDIDGVLRDLMFGLDDIYLRVHPEHADLISPHLDWDLTKRYPIGKDIYDFLFREHSFPIFGNSPVYRGALACFNKCRALTTTGIITSQTEETVQATMYWLAWNGFRPDFLHIVYIDYGIESRNIKSKPEVDDDIWLLIDDHSRNLEKWDESGRPCICLDREYNQDWSGERIHDPDMYEKLYARILELISSCES